MGDFPVLVLRTKNGDVGLPFSWLFLPCILFSMVMAFGIHLLITAGVVGTPPSVLTAVQPTILPSEVPKYPDTPADFTRRSSHSFGLVSSLLPQGFVSFADILQNSSSAKKIHWYGPMYAEYLDPIRLQNQPVNLLEIGLYGGASLDMWLQAFPRGKIYGMEYDSRHLQKTDRVINAESQVTIFPGDQANVTLLNEISQVVREEVGTLDIIVDDGGHTMNQQITSFTHLMPLLRPGGLYFIEDLQTSYYEKKCFQHWNGEPYCYGGGPPGKKGTTIDLIKSFIDVLNADFMEDHEPLDKLGSGVYHVNPADKYIGSVQCWRNMCVFRKKFAGSQL